MFKNRDIITFLVSENDFSMSGCDIPTSVSDITILFNGIAISDYDKPKRGDNKPVCIYDKPVCLYDEPVCLYDVTICLYDEPVCILYRPISYYYSMVSQYDFPNMYFSKPVSKVFKNV